MLASDIITDRVRELISDGFETTADNYRWPDTVLIRRLGDALNALWARRPSAFAIDTILVEQPANPTALTGTVLVNDEWLEPLAYRVASYALLDDSEDVDNSGQSEKFRLYWEGALQ